MAAPATLPALLDTLTKSLASALELAPKISTIDAPKDGISLLDVKNELLLSYLQNLVFLILLKLRQARTGAHKKNDDDDQSLDDLVVKKLVELRLYLEKGVRPLEDKLRYQIDKVLRAADDAERSAKQADAAAKAAAEQPDSDSEAAESGDEDQEAAAPSGQKLSDLQFRPNISSFVRNNGAPGIAERPKIGVGKSTDAAGVYRPPRIAPTVMPTTTTERRERGGDKKPLKSHTLDEFIADEMSTAPVAEPSIGTTIVNFGRRTKTVQERKVEEERRTYEEANFVRLPTAGKKDKAKQRALEGRSNKMQFGGEDWRDLGVGVDRINRLTSGGRDRKGTKALLEKSRKRGFDTTDGPKGDGGSGVAMGERFQKKLKVLEGGRRDRGKGR
ncbi:Sas10/Utp3/C1D family-domain-containing protein [Pseudoneurospora amorphoporcata]|uniref:Sas10/Utp3/C1D family-domain-containing protein n=1 Tax=Pseudoneurospora amorphoporcata TaxID=241081 RepID=A0AAN6NUQ8_9PEZI|nr:Sas10/Utp3/C1D family-domain-containing protein [Pseudoneurospora amorphoporcata]